MLSLCVWLTDLSGGPQGASYQSSNLLAADPGTASQQPQQPSSSPFQPQDPSQVPQSQPPTAPVDTLLPEAAVAAAAANQSQSGLYGTQGFGTEQDRLQSSSASLDAAYSSEQTFSQSLMSQSLDSATAQHTISFGGTDQSASQPPYSHSMDQTVGISSNSADTGPQPIPLPNQTVPGQSIGAQSFGSSDSQTFGATGDSQTFSAGGDTATYGAADTSQGYGGANNQGFGTADQQNYGGPDAQGMTGDGQVGGMGLHPYPRQASPSLVLRA